MDDVMALRLGSEVLIGPPDDTITGRITGVAVYEGPRIQYQVVWFDNRQRYSEWLDECEVRSKDTANHMPIGFTKAKGDDHANGQ